MQRHWNKLLKQSLMFSSIRNFRLSSVINVSIFIEPVIQTDTRLDALVMD